MLSNDDIYSVFSIVTCSASYVYIVYSIRRCINVKFYIRYRMCCSYERTQGIAWGVGGVGAWVGGSCRKSTTQLQEVHIQLQEVHYPARMNIVLLYCKASSVG